MSKIKEQRYYQYFEGCYLLWTPLYEMLMDVTTPEAAKQIADIQATKIGYGTDDEITVVFVRNADGFWVDANNCTADE